MEVSRERLTNYNVTLYEGLTRASEEEKSGRGVISGGQRCVENIASLRVAVEILHRLIRSFWGSGRGMGEEGFEGTIKPGN